MNARAPLAPPRFIRWATACAVCGAAIDAGAGVLEIGDHPRALCIPCAWVPAPGFAITDDRLYGYQRVGAGWLPRCRAGLLGDEPGLGKGHPIGTPVLTPHGWRSIDALRVGDEVIGSSGRATRVSGVFPRGVLHVFRVTFSDGATVLCDGDHLWALRNRGDRARGNPCRVVETRALVDSPRWRSLQIPLVAPVHFAPQPAACTPIDPYLLGVWLGDGSGGAANHSVTFACGDEDVPREVEQRLPSGMRLVRKRNGDRCDSWSVSGTMGQPNAVLDYLRERSLATTYSPERFVPEPYLLATPEQRLALLRGLMDTDGELRPSDQHAEFASSSRRLADAVAFLVRSLGGTARVRVREITRYRHKGELRQGLPSFRVTIAMPGGVSPFLARTGYKGREKYPAARTLVSVDPEGAAEVVCIRVEAEDHLYVTKDLIVTHNTPQALRAWVALGLPPAVAVVKPSVRRQWGREAGRWAPEGRVRVQESGGDAWAPPRQGELLVVGYPGVRGWAYTVHPGTVVILDEAQDVANPGAQQTLGARALCAAALSSGGRGWLLTATPAHADDAQVWEVFRAVELHRALHPSLTRWRELSPAEQRRRVDRVMLRRRAQDELDLPPLRVETLTVPLGPVDVAAIEEAAALAIAQRQLTDEAPADSTLAITPEDVARRAKALTAEQVRSALTKLAEGDEPGVELALATVRRLVAVSKLPRALELVEEQEGAGAPIVVACDHRDPVLALAARPGWGAVVGGQTANERDEVLAAFAAGGRGIAMTYGAGGTGLDGLQKIASRALLLELTWTPAQVEQFLGRLVRIGQTGTAVLATLLEADHWVDKVVTAIARRKIAKLADLGLELAMAGRFGA